ncbi:hypothetical protein [Cytobacillus purgationiresistens]|uniref:RNA-binding protein with RPS1 domain n=1 Tax=Cytobacillus purgationiresistens TaxID=863449 RepID=A0ABU0AEN4_9BACI|nr:hypothetical protein [Cytobacillus purgationiresistens]MDQ0269714.1 putative RNA-binding protein with RPS1 domain [Cytobacillus purgationiresistens]
MDKCTLASTFPEALKLLLGRTIDIFAHTSFTSGVLTKVEDGVIVITEIISGYVTDINEVIIPIWSISHVEVTD